jgi:nitroreductase/NAD-dependent dihydropyrimidine dehydrogenase PreA subunit
MSKFTITIDRKKCNKCGLCVSDCISGCLLLKDGRPEALNPGWCSQCSHCVAICPKNAVEHSGLKGMPARETAKEKYNPEMYRNIVTARRSIRRFKDKDIPEKIIEDILQLAAYSPTASNSRDVGYTVFTDKDIIRQIGQDIYKKFEKMMRFLKRPPASVFVALLNLLAPKKSISSYLDRQEFFTEWFRNGRDLITHGAPVLIIIHGPKKSRFARENSAIAACNITNYAHALGLGTCYIGLINVALDLNRKLRLKLNVPKGRKCYIALVMGYPAHRYQHTAIRPDPVINWIGDK